MIKFLYPVPGSGSAVAELIGRLLLLGAHQFLPFAPQVQPLGLGKRAAESDHTGEDSLEEILRENKMADCGKLMVCGLAGDEEADLVQEELTILNLFKTDLSSLLSDNKTVRYGCFTPIPNNINLSRS